MARWVLCIILTIGASFSFSAAWANTEAVQAFTYEGRLYDSFDSPLAEIVTFRLQVYNDAEDCLLYEEEQTLDLTTTNGQFSLEIGSAVGAGKRTADDPGFAMWQVFQNTLSLSPPVGVCASAPYNPSWGDKRKLQVTVTATGSGFSEVLSPMQTITSAPSSLMSQSLQGIGKDGFIQTNAGVGLTQNVAQDLASQHTELMALAGGTSSQYVLTGGNVNSNLIYSSDQIAVGTSTPASGVELEIRKSDPTIRLSATDGGAGAMEIQFLDTSGEDHAAISVQEGSNAMTFSTGGASALTLDSSQNAGFQASVTVAGTIRGGIYTAALEISVLTPSLTGCGAACAGTQWMNSDLDELRYWDGAAIRSVGSYSGALGASGQVLTSNGPGAAPTWQAATATDSTKLPLTGGTLTGPLVLVQENNASNPELTFNGDLDTGIYSPGGNQMSFSTGGAERLRINGSGNTIATGSFETESSLILNGNIVNNAEGLPRMNIDSSQFQIDLDHDNDSSSERFTLSRHDNSENLFEVDTSGNAKIYGDLRIYDGMATNHLGFSAPATVSTSTVWQLPDGDGTSGQVLSTDGSGALSWVSRGGGSGDFLADGSVPMTGNIRLNGNYLSNDGGNEGIAVDNDGNVGIGTASPSERLEVSGHLSLSGTLKFPANSSVAGGSNNIRLITNGTPRLRIQDAITGINDANADAHLEVSADGTTGGAVLMISSDDDNDGDLLIVNESGNVGIGTTAPVDNLTVSDSENTSTRISITTPGTNNNQQAALNLVTQDNGGILGTGANKGWTLTTRGDAYSTSAQRNDLGFSYWNGTSWSDPFRIDSLTGHVGIGTTDPAVELDVNTGTINAAQLCDENNANCLDLSAGVGGGSGDFLADGTVPMTGNLNLNGNYLSGDGDNAGVFVAAGGNVGIGTASPSTSLDVRSSIITPLHAERSNSGVVATHRSTSGSAYLDIDAGGATDSSYTRYQRSGATQWSVGNDGSLDGSSTKDDFVISDTFNLSSPRLVIDGTNGNVGIGQSSPQTQFHISHSTDASSNRVMRLDGNDRSVAADDDEAYMSFYLDDSTGVANEYARMGWVATDVTDTSENGGLTFSIPFEGVMTEALRLYSTSDDTSVYKDTKMTMTGNGNNNYGVEIEVNNTNAGFQASHATFTARADNIVGRFMAVESNSPFSNTTEDSLILGTSSNHSLHLVTNGVGQMMVTAAGEIGIGTTSPAVELDVHTGTINAAQICDENNANCLDLSAGVGGGSGDFLADGTVPMTGNLRLNSQWLSGDGGSEGVFVDSSGNVGIGESTLSNRFTVSDNSGTAARFSSRDSGAGNELQRMLELEVSTSGTPAAGLGTGILFSGRSSLASGRQLAGIDAISTDVTDSSRDADLVFSTVQDEAGYGNLTEHMRIQSTGNVGIGNSSPSSALEIGGDSFPGEILLTDNDSIRGMRLSGDNGVSINPLGNTSLALSTDGWPVTIGSWGSITDAHFEINRLGNRSHYFNISSADGVDGDVFTVRGSGRVGVGTDSPAVELDVHTGTINAAQICDENNANCLDLSSGVGGSGDFLANGSVPMTGNLNLHGNYLSGDGDNEGVFVDTGGSVGIGTTTPLSEAHIDSQDGSTIILSSSNVAVSTGDLLGAINFGATNEFPGNTTPRVGFKIEARGDANLTTSDSPTHLRFLGIKDGANTEDEWMRMVDGNVGIGTVSPAVELDVHTGTINAAQICDENNANCLDLSSGVGGGSGDFLADGSVPMTGNLQLGSQWLSSDGDNEGISINASGHVGIGTSTPDEVLHIVDDSVAQDIIHHTIRANSEQSSDYIFRKSKGSIGAETTVVDTEKLGGIRFQGYDGSAYQTTVQMSTLVNGTVSSGNVPTDLIFYLDPTGTAYNVADEVMRLTSARNVGIGTDAPSEKLHVVGNLRVQGSTDCTLGNGSAATNCSSDERLKNNITPISDALEKVHQLRGVNFTWNNQSLAPGKEAIGVIAQDVQKVFPTSVVEHDTGYLAVDYASLVAPLIQATKELDNKCEMSKEQIKMLSQKDQQQDRELASLKKETRQLRQENAELRERLEKIEQMLMKNDH